MITKSPQYLDAFLNSGLHPRITKQTSQNLIIAWTRILSDEASIWGFDILIFRRMKSRIFGGLPLALLVIYLPLPTSSWDYNTLAWESQIFGLTITAFHQADLGEKNSDWDSTCEHFKAAANGKDLRVAVA